MEDYMFEYSINMLIHKLVHVLAVGHRNFVRFIDPETNEIKENSIEFFLFYFFLKLFNL